MSVRVSTWVWHETTAKGNDRLMLLALADNANDDGWCWPGVAQLVDKTMLGRSTVFRRLDVLEAAGLVERYTRADAGRTTVYRVAVPWADAGSWPAERCGSMPQSWCGPLNSSSFTRAGSSTRPRWCSTSTPSPRSPFP